MKRLGTSAAFSAALLIGCAGVAYAADDAPNPPPNAQGGEAVSPVPADTSALAYGPNDPVYTKAPPLLTKAPIAPQGPRPCDSVPGFFLTDCQLSYYGIRF